MKTKICSKCNMKKNLSDFHKDKYTKDNLSYKCKLCTKIYDKNYRIINKEKLLKNSKEYYAKNRDKIKKHCKIYKKLNKEKINLYNKTKYKNNINYRILCNLRSRLSMAIAGVTKTDTTKNLLDCSIEHLKKHLESQFSEGMNWDNYGLNGWEIDHIIPCSKFNLSVLDQQKECFHYTNLQPLWASDNRRKNSKKERKRCQNF